MKYARVQNNQVIDSNRDLPTSWENISNFNVFDDALLKEYGWYPYKFISIDVPDGYILDGTEYIITENEVIETEKKRLKTEEEIQEEIQSIWNLIRVTRNQKLLSSDWTQLPDSPLTTEKKEEWINYRKNLRDITLQLNPFEINWPTEPN